MRLFIAIDLPQEIKDFLAGLQTRLKKSGADIKWVSPKNIHLTLKFLGEIDDTHLVDKINSVLENIASNKPPFRISFNSIGAFPSLKSARIIWVGVNKGQDTIKEISEDFENKLQDLGIAKEDRPFSSHITIGRTRSSLNREKLIKGIDELSTEIFDKKNPVEFTVTAITLFKSTLTAKGPIYEVVKDAKFKVIN